MMAPLLCSASIANSATIAKPGTKPGTKLLRVMLVRRVIGLGGVYFLFNV